MKLNGKLLLVLASLTLASALCAGCGMSRTELRSEATAVIDQNFTDAPLRDVLIAIEKAGSRGIATDASVDLDQVISVRFEGVSPNEAVDAIAKLAQYEWIYDPDLPETMKARTDSLTGQYWDYPMYLIAKNVEEPIFVTSPVLEPEEPPVAELEEPAAAEPEEPEGPPLIVWPPRETTETPHKPVRPEQAGTEPPGQKEPEKEETIRQSESPAEAAIVTEAPRAAEVPAKTTADIEALEAQPKVSNVFMNTDIREAISDIAAQTGVNIVSDASVEGWVTLSLEEVPLEPALAMVSLSSGFTWKKMGDY